MWKKSSFFLFLLFFLMLSSEFCRINLISQENRINIQFEQAEENRAFHAQATVSNISIRFDLPSALSDNYLFEHEDEYLITGSEEYGQLFDTYKQDGTYLYYLVFIDGSSASYPSFPTTSVRTWYIHYYTSIPISYLGELQITYRTRYARNGLSTLSYTYDTEYNLSSDYILNERIYLEIEAVYTWTYTDDSGDYIDKYRIRTYVYGIKNNGDKITLNSTDTGDINGNDPDHKNYPTKLYLDVDLVKIQTHYISNNVVPEHEVLDNGNVVHKIEFFIPVSGTVVTFLDLPDDWSFYSSTPIVDFDSDSNSFTAVVYGFYQIWFVSYDPWNYDEYRLSRIAYHTSRGDTLPFDSFHTYYAESPNRLIQYAPDVNDEDLVAWFRFNEGSGTTTTDWKQGIEGTLYGSPSWVTGYIGKAIEFDGSDDYVKVSEISDLPTSSQSRSIEVWFYPNTHNQGILVFWGASGVSNEACGLRLYSSGTDYGIRWYFWGNDIAVETGNLAKKWNHVVATYDISTGERRIYLNGKLIGTDYPTAPDTASSALYIGSRCGYIEFFDGIIDEVRIYKRALTPEEIWWHYALVFYFDGLRDVMGREPYTSSITGISQGIFGYCSEFDGEDDVIAYYMDWAVASLGGGTYIGIGYQRIPTKYGGGGNDYMTFFERKGNPYEILFMNWYSSAGNYHGTLRDYTGGAWRIADTYFARNKDGWFFTLGMINSEQIYVSITDFSNKPSNTKDIDFPSQPVPESEFTSLIFEVGKSTWYNRYAYGYIDEVIVLREPLSQEMLDKIYHIAEKYIGGYYTDESFRATWDAETDSPETSHGFSEDFSDISDIEYTSGSDLSTDGDVAKWHIPSGDPSNWWLIFTDMDWINPNTYPFIEIRLKFDTSATSNKPSLYVSVDLDGDGTEDTYEIYYFDFYTSWTIWRKNLKEWLIERGVTVSSTTRIKLKFKWWRQQDCYLDWYLDWLRVYKIEGYDNYYWQVDSHSWVSSIGGVIIIHDTFSSDSYYERTGQVFNPDITIDENLFVTFRCKVNNPDIAHFAILFRIYDGSTYYWRGYDVFSDDWETVVYNFQSTYYGMKLTAIYFAVSENSKSESGEALAYLDYIRIGYLQEQVQDAEWIPMYDSLFEFPVHKYIWLNTTDIWGNQLVYEPLSYTPFIDKILPVYSWKFHNGLDDQFIHINITNGNYWWSEWLAPKETAEYILYPDTYTLKVTYTNGSYFTTQLSVSTDYFWMLQGNVLSDVLGNIAEVLDKVDEMGENITNVNSTIHNQIININTTITNWNSDINSTVVNVYINLNNVNSSISDLIINNQMLINNMYSTMNQSFLNIDVRMYNNFTQISGQILSVNNTVLNVNSTVHWQMNQISTQITNVQTNMTTQFNWVFTNITNVNATLYAQTVAISADINNMWSDMNASFVDMDIRLYNNFTKIDTYLVDVNNTIYVINSTINNMNNTLTVQITNLQTNITYQFNHILANITNVNSTILQSVSYIQTDLKHVKDNTDAAIGAGTRAYQESIKNREALYDSIKLILIALAAVGGMTFIVVQRKTVAKEKVAFRKKKKEYETVLDKYRKQLKKQKEKYEKEKKKLYEKLRKKSIKAWA